MSATFSLDSGLKTITPSYLPFPNLANDSIEKDKLTQNQLDFNNKILYRIKFSKLTFSKLFPLFLVGISDCKMDF